MRRSLFFKIFFWFWMALGVLIAAIAVAVIATETDPVGTRWRELMGRALTFQTYNAVQVFERDGAQALETHLNRLQSTTQIRATLLDGNARELVQQGIPPGAEPLIARAQQSNRPEAEFSRDKTLAALQVESVSGKRYVLVCEVPGGLMTQFRATPRVRLFRFLAAILTVGLVCYGLARYLTKPIVALRAATQRLAGGDLSARVNETSRQDELADLGRDFNQMAERIEALMKSQQRLVGDVSHELRSPLARLSVALELARLKAGTVAAPELDRIERETGRLNELIGQLLTLAKLESGVSAQPMGTVALDELVKDVVTDAKFEATGRNREVNLLRCDQCRTDGSPELLRRAIENVIRNAVRYTLEGGAVEVTLERAGNQAVISVRDFGKGVPEASLDELFEPFYRVAEARDRQTGGIGLGLAITKSAIQLHGGQVRAANSEGGGLIITMTLPAT
ncbi:MAG TPA: ATP-binding protein [Blastocatellia bacterium]|nr:ATP-binding protein [Blastocatellia bacterium]